MKILLASDGSACSSRAVRFCTHNLAQFGKNPQVILVNVDPPVLERMDAQIAQEDIVRFHARNANVAVRAARRLLTAAGVRFRERLLVGDPAETIARLARSERADLIVMGSHGRSALKSLFAGSVVQRVLSLTRVPVLVVR